MHACDAGYVRSAPHASAYLRMRSGTRASSTANDSDAWGSRCADLPATAAGSGIPARKCSCCVEHCQMSARGGGMPPQSRGVTCIYSPDVAVHRLLSTHLLSDSSCVRWRVSLSGRLFCVVQCEFSERLFCWGGLGEVFSFKKGFLTCLGAPACPRERGGEKKSGCSRYLVGEAQSSLSSSEAVEFPKKNSETSM